VTDVGAPRGAHFAPRSAPTTRVPLGARRSLRDQFRHSVCAALADELKRRGALAPGISTQAAADTIDALAADATVYLRLIDACGWSDDRSTDLIARTLTATLRVL
jgi:hypothetical protein